MHNRHLYAFANYLAFMIKCRISMVNDLRVIRSRKSIENAFINLVEMKGFQNISVIEIAKVANVNRNTIYLNYGSKEGILESIVIESVRKYFGNLSPEFFRSIGPNRRKIEGMFTKLFNVVDENIELYRVLLIDQSSAGYLQIELIKLRKIMEGLFKPSAQNKIKISFLVYGIMGTLNNYITLGLGTKEENIKILTDLTISNLRHVSYSK